jgi:hypothetical protein
MPVSISCNMSLSCEQCTTFRPLQRQVQSKTHVQICTHYYPLQ